MYNRCSRRNKFSKRPLNFVLDPNNRLHSGLVLALLGRGAGSTLAVDSSPYGNNGTLSGFALSGTTSNWVSAPELGRTGIAFAGDNDCVSCPTVTLASGLTMACWWRSNGDYTTSQCLLGVSDASATISTVNAIIFGYVDNKIQFRRGNGTTDVTATPTFSSDDWIHIAITTSGSTSAWTLSVYVNGVLDNSGASSVNTVSSGSIALGRLGGYASYYLNGSTCDSAIWNRSLSPAEIAILANRSDPMLGGLIVPSEFVGKSRYFGGMSWPQPQPLAPTIITRRKGLPRLGNSGLSITRPREFHLDSSNSLYNGLQFAMLGRGALGVTAFDSSRYMNDCSLNGYSGSGDTPQDRWVFDLVLGRWSLGFDGINDYLTLAKLPVSAPPFSVSAWFYTSVTDGVQTIWSCQLSTNNDYMHRLILYQSKVQAQTQALTGGIAATTAAYGTNKWQHACGVWSASNLRSAYLNGGNVGSDTVDKSPTVDRSRIGKVEDGTYPEYMSGKLADVMVWSRILTLPEIQILANRSDALIGGLIVPDEPGSPTEPRLPTISVPTKPGYNANIIQPKNIIAPRQRPREDFVLNPNNNLYNGLQFALLGRGAGTKVAIDSSPYGRNGILTGYSGNGDLPSDKWQFDATIGRWALGFDGSDDIVTSPIKLDTMTPSVSMWCKCPSPLAYMPIFGFGHTAGLMLSAGGTAPKPYMVGWSLTPLTFQPDVTTFDGSWHHLVFQINGRYELFVDGIGYYSSSVTGSLANAPWTLYIGGNDGYYLSFSASDVLVHSRALSPAEIKILADRSDPSLGGLVVPVV